MLTDQEKAILDLEELMPGHSPYKTDAILRAGMSVARYYQALHVLHDHAPEARKDYPDVMRRLDRRRAA